MNPSVSRKKVGVFSHGGTRNLGDEALFAAVVQNVLLHIPDAEIVGFTINPYDTLQRHAISSSPIRRLGKTSQTGSGSNPTTQSKASKTKDQPKKVNSTIVDTVKAIPGLRSLMSRLRQLVGVAADVIAEPKFLFDSYRRLKGVDLLLVAGSQQLNDGYGGAWGFPFTLFKWTLLSKLTGTKVAILSVGAGPISSPLSKFFFKRVL